MLIIAAVAPVQFDTHDQVQSSWFFIYEQSKHPQLTKNGQPQAVTLGQMMVFLILSGHK